jgi:hypothetical protein
MGPATSVQTGPRRVVVAIAEADAVAVTASFARSLRIALWRKHLGVTHSAVRDCAAGLKLWKQPAKSAMASPYWTDVPERIYSGKLAGYENKPPGSATYVLF